MVLIVYILVLGLFSCYLYMFFKLYEFIINLYEKYLVLCEKLLSKYYNVNIIDLIV